MVSTGRTDQPKIALCQLFFKWQSIIITDIRDSSTPLAVAFSVVSVPGGEARLWILPEERFGQQWSDSSDLGSLRMRDNRPKLLKNRLWWNLGLQEKKHS